MDDLIGLVKLFGLLYDEQF